MNKMLPTIVCICLIGFLAGCEINEMVSREKEPLHIVNGSFNDWSEFDMPRNWQVENPLRVFKDDVAAPGNPPSLKISFPQDSADFVTLRQRIRVNKNERVLITGNVRTEGLTAEYDSLARAGAGIYVRTDTDSIRSDTLVADSSKVWIKLYVEFDTDESDSVDVVLFIGADENKCTGTALFDDITIKEL